jgi:hypothetical protein
MNALVLLVAVALRFASSPQFEAVSLDFRIVEIVC